MAVALGLMLLAALEGCASSPAEPIALAVKTLGRSEGRSGQNVDESRLLAGVAGVWRRGEVLTVDTEEGIQYRLVDAGTCEGSDTCRVWTFQGSIQAAREGEPDKGPADYRLVEASDGEGVYWLAINVQSGSSMTLDAKPIASPDKRRWAVGACNFLSGFSLDLFDAGEIGQMTLAAKASDDADCCDVLGWDGAALKVKTCDLEPGKAYTDRLVRQADGRWAGKRIRLQKPKAP